MKALMIIGGIILILYLLSLVPLQVKVNYGQAGFGVLLGLGSISIPVVGGGKKGKKERKKSKKRPRIVQKTAQEGQQEQEKPRKSPGKEAGKRKEERTNKWNTWVQFQDSLPLICQAAGELRRKILVRRLQIHLVWAGEDPAAAAMGYGLIHGIIGVIWGMIDYNFRVKKHKFVVDLNYQATKPQVEADAVLSLNLGQIISFGIRYAVKFITMQRNAGSDMAHEHEKENLSYERAKASHQ